MTNRLDNLVEQAQEECWQAEGFLKDGALKDAETKLDDLDTTLARISALLDSVKHALKGVLK